jgi:hypothetical protein
MSEQAVQTPEDTASNADTRCATNSAANSSLITDVRLSLIIRVNNNIIINFRILSYPSQANRVQISQRTQFPMLTLAMKLAVLSAHQAHPR